MIGSTLTAVEPAPLSDPVIEAVGLERPDDAGRTEDDWDLYASTFID